MLESTGSLQWRESNSSLVTDEAGQDFDALIFGDVVAPFADRAGSPSQEAAGGSARSAEVPAKVQYWPPGSPSMKPECLREVHDKTVLMRSCYDFARREKQQA